jgi:hypothetical protein
VWCGDLNVRMKHASCKPFSFYPSYSGF